MDFSAFSAAIFDLDGTLADSNTIWEKLDGIFLENHGISADDRFIKKLASLTYEDAAIAMRDLGIDISAEDFASKINVLAEKEYSHNIMLKEYADSLLKKLKKEKLKIVLATGSPRSLFEPLLRRAGVFPLFDGFVSTDEIGKSKDFPDIYIKAAKIAGVPINKCIIFEDAVGAVRTAAATGGYVCAVYDKYSRTDSEEIIRIADKYVLNFNELL